MAMQEQRSIPLAADEPKRLGMDELSFFVQMVKSTLQGAGQQDQNRFWWALYRHCPNMANAIRASLTGPWSEITFTRTLHTSTCGLDDTAGLQLQEHHGKEGDVPTHE